ncbi:winged helix-turn-helix domain-containing protein [Dethiothermospora halolimnae]|uniref:winged helix-turn-helix domain-containing protein n=1 Tax=Dethiothermospora halolimnae TaxID=3114390 RepID=UPI003CCB7FD7
MEVGFKVWLKENDKKVFGKGPKELLLKIEELGSIRQASIDMGMSYSKAWKLVANLEETLNIKILEKTIGGSHGGSSLLTEEARKLIKKYEAFEKEAQEKIKDLYHEIF